MKIALTQSVCNNCYFRWTPTDWIYAESLAEARNNPKLKAGTHENPLDKNLEPVQANLLAILAEMAVARVLSTPRHPVLLLFSPWPAGGDPGWDLMFNDIKVEVKWNSHRESVAYLYINEDLAEPTIRGERAEVLVLVLGDRNAMWIDGYARSCDMQLKSGHGLASVQNFGFGFRRAVKSEDLRPFIELTRMKV